MKKHTFKFPNGFKYVGEIKNNKFNGQGALTFPGTGKNRENMLVNSKMASIMVKVLSRLVRINMLANSKMANLMVKVS